MANFKIVKNAAVWWPVTFNQAIDGGQVEEVRFEMKFRRVTATEYAELVKLGDNVDFINRTTIDWRGISDDSGQVPFGDVGIARVLDVPNVVTAIGLAWQGFIEGQPETRLGNSAPSLAGGPAVAAATVDQTATATA